MPANEQMTVRELRQLLFKVENQDALVKGLLEIRTKDFDFVFLDNRDEEVEA